MSRHKLYDTDQHPKTLALAIHAPYNRIMHMESYFEEFLNLIRANRITYDHVDYIKLRSIDSTYFLTKGKLHDVRTLCEEHEIEEVIISESLTARQERNLEKFLGRKIFDRTYLILEIFEKAATSAEGKTQVAIAMLQHQKSRLAGKGIHLSQQSGHIGVRGGFGETLKEKESRHIDTAILKLKRHLKQLEEARKTQRKRRIISNVPQFCLIGYTNVGKSTILNALTKSDVLAEDKLFATLDTTTRELYINNKKKGVISDTVGFIQNLPHHLIEAFKSTLSELKYADLLLHVVDLSDPNFENHITVVQNILHDLNLEKPVLYVFNKSDKTTNLKTIIPHIATYQPHVIVSAHTENGLSPLISYIGEWSSN